jgi:hypothetical protein
MCHTDQLQTQPARINWLFRAAILVLLAIIALAIVCGGCLGCVPKPIPTTQQAISAPTSAIGHIQQADKHIVAAQPFTRPPGDSELASARKEAAAALDDSKTARSEAEAMVGQLNDAQARIDALARKLEEVKEDAERKHAAVVESYEGPTGKLTRAIVERDEAKQQYHDAWIGGATWRLIGWITGVGVLLTLLGLFLNAKTDWFVYVWEFIVGVAAGILRVIGTIFGGIAKAFRKQEPAK